MVRYRPIHPEITIQASGSDLRRLEMERTALSADFSIPNETTVVRVKFEKTLVVRVLDEMLISTEESAEGLVSEHFAYVVEGAIDSLSRSMALATMSPDSVHYRFITGWRCLDVLSDHPPIVSVVSAT